jgi:methionyl-tRNA formyltransferase
MTHIRELEQWGKYIVPGQKTIAPSALKIAIFGSFYGGIAVTRALIDLQKNSPELVHVVGLATDAITDPRAKISAQKRIWQFVDSAQRESIERDIINDALNAGIPVYSGKIKTDIFRTEILPEWDPDVILMRTFGQLIDPPVFEYPRYGMYNLHPSHLAEGKYPGPNPFTEVLDTGESNTRMTLHEVDENFDTGRVFGYSPPINIQLSQGVRVERPAHVIALHKQTARAAAIIAQGAVSEIARTRSKLENLDCEVLFTDSQKKSLMQPIGSDFAEIGTMSMMTTSAALAVH